MSPPQKATARHESRNGVPVAVASAATLYQSFREIEAEHLALMARHNLLEEWTPETRVTVLAAREKVREARAARAGFRDQVRELVVAMRNAREPLPAALRITRAMVQLLEHQGVIRSDGGWLEAEVLQWVIEDYEVVS